MRIRSLILILSGVLLCGTLVLWSLFWFVCPRWWPSLVIGYSPSLHHVLTTNALWAWIPRSGSTFPLFDYTRFERRYGSEIYTAMADCDNGSDPDLRMIILQYLRQHAHDPLAMKVVWQYREMGDRKALDIIAEHANRVIPQGVDTRNLLPVDPSSRPPSP